MRFRPNDLPEGASEFQETADGFTVKLSIDSDEEGYFGRECPDCGGYFKMSVSEYKALPDDIQLSCAYCGYRAEHSDFMTTDQKERAVSAVREIVMPAITSEMNRTLKSIERRPQPRNLIDFSIQVKPGRRTPKPLHTYMETETRRELSCNTCGNHTAVYRISMFCPVCGMRPPLEAFNEGVRATRAALEAFTKIPSEVAALLEAQGGAEALYVSALVDVVSAFETYARERFRLSMVDRVGNAEADRLVDSLRPNAFQNLANADALYDEHSGISLQALVSGHEWTGVSLAFERRHLFQHRRGIVDERYIERSGDRGARIGMRLSINERQVLEAVALVEKLAEAVEKAGHGQQREKLTSP